MNDIHPPEKMSCIDPNNGVHWDGKARMDCPYYYSHKQCMIWAMGAKPHVLAHEIGHALFGFRHASLGTHIYGDSSCLMGNQKEFMQFSALNRINAHWINSWNQMQVVTETKSYPLLPFQQMTSEYLNPQTPKTLVIPIGCCEAIFISLSSLRSFSRDSPTQIPWKTYGISSLWASKTKTEPMIVIQKGRLKDKEPTQLLGVIDFVDFLDQDASKKTFKNDNFTLTVAKLETSFAWLDITLTNTQKDFEWFPIRRSPLMFFSPDADDFSHETKNLVNRFATPTDSDLQEHNNDPNEVIPSSPVPFPFNISTPPLCTAPTLVIEQLRDFNLSRQTDMMQTQSLHAFLSDDGINPCRLERQQQMIFDLRVSPQGSMTMDGVFRIQVVPQHLAFGNVFNPGAQIIRINVAGIASQTTSPSRDLIFSAISQVPGAIQSVHQNVKVYQSITFCQLKARWRWQENSFRSLDHVKRVSTAHYYSYFYIETDDGCPKKSITKGDVINGRIVVDKHPFDATSIDIQAGKVHRSNVRSVEFQMTSYINMQINVHVHFDGVPSDIDEITITGHLELTNITNVFPEYTQRNDLFSNPTDMQFSISVPIYRNCTRFPALVGVQLQPYIENLRMQPNTPHTFSIHTITKDIGCPAVGLPKIKLLPAHTHVENKLVRPKSVHSQSEVEFEIKSDLQGGGQFPVATLTVQDDVPTHNRTSTSIMALESSKLEVISLDPPALYIFPFGIGEQDERNITVQFQLVEQITCREVSMILLGIRDDRSAIQAGWNGSVTWSPIQWQFKQQGYVQSQVKPFQAQNLTFLFKPLRGNGGSKTGDFEIKVELLSNVALMPSLVSELNIRFPVRWHWSFWVLVFGIPGIVVVIGIIVWWKRRRKNSASYQRVESGVMIQMEDVKGE